MLLCSLGLLEATNMSLNCRPHAMWVFTAIWMLQKMSFISLFISGSQIYIKNDVMMM